MNRKMQVAALLGATMLSTSVWAQDVDEVIVLSSPFKKAATDVISTTKILTAEDLVDQANRPIGDVLSSLPGVSSAGFGPAVGQPVIRGLGGYRIDVMENGMSLGDVSATGGDHANGLKLFDTQRIEVLKGPAALRYGAFAATGVINSFNRHMDETAEDNSDILLELGDNAGEVVTALHARRGSFAISAYAHDADDITIPTHGESEAAHENEGHSEELDDAETEGENTRTEGRGFTVSGLFGSEQTSLALMLSSIEMDYGVPGHAHEDDAPEGGEIELQEGDDDHEDEGVSIDLEQQTVHARLIHQAIGDLVDTVRADMTVTSYQHDEIEEGGGASFEQDSVHMRFESGLKPIGEWSSLVGFDYRNSEMQTTGLEAFVPSTDRNNIAIFAITERSIDAWLTELALRVGTAEIETANGTETSFDITNAAAGLAYKTLSGTLIGGSLTSSERAPSQVELFADGFHAAASRTEEGDASLEKETALASEIYLRGSLGNKSRYRIALFNNDYQNFIHLHPEAHEDGGGDDDEHDHEGETFAYEQQDAEVSGYEAEAMFDLVALNHDWQITLRFSETNAELDNGENVRAIPPFEAGIGLATVYRDINLTLNIDHASAQNETGEDELPTEGFTNIDISASYQPPQYEGLTISAGIRNLTDEEIRHHASPLKDRMPEAGQDIRISARYKF